VWFFLGAGILIGMRHALEADHLAAVVALSTRTRGRMATMLRGAAWGLGHTTALLVVGGASLALGTSLSQTSEQWLERAVGAMLILLGAQVIARLVRSRVRVSQHAHDGVVHIHAHAWVPQTGSRHHHQHADRSHLRAALVGTVHGMAGSAALVVLTSATAGSFWMGLAYIASFGVGSMLGMAALSLAISLPLELSSRRLGHAYGLVEVPIACATMVLGLWMLR
jgi:ABC-type nickel/cobalt efflux system permease component RcnA